MRYLLMSLLSVGIVTQAATVITLYQGGFAFVEEERVIELVGDAEAVIRGLPATIVPGSISLEGLEASSWRLERPATGVEGLVGKEVLVSYAGGTARGVLLSAAGGLLLRTREGYLFIPAYDSVLSPEEPPLSGLPALRVSLSAPPAAEKAVLRYLVRDLSWEAHYVARYADGTLTLRGMALIVNRCGVDFRDAEVFLVAGEVFGPKAVPEKGRALALAAAPEVSPVAEYHRYAIPGAVDLPRGEAAVGYLPRTRVGATEVYRFSGGPVLFILRFTNTTGFPLPGGVVRVFGEGAFLGEAAIAHTPEGEEAELPLGAAFDLSGERVRTEYVRLGKDRYRERYRIVIRSAKEEPVVVEVIEELPGEWRIVESTLPYEALDAHRVRFLLPVPAGGEGRVEYTVEYSY